MHPVKDTLNRDNDLTDKFKGFIESIIKDAQKALILADCPCPYPAETQMSKILNSVREATQVVHTVANDYQHRVPDTPEKEAVIREAWEKAEAIDAKQSDTFESPSVSLDDLFASLVKSYDKPIYNCCPGFDSAGDFALWLTERIKELQTKNALSENRNKELLAEREFHARLVSKANTIIDADKKHAELVDILSEPDLMRPDGSPCYCNPSVPNRMEDFGTHSLFGVCDGEGKEVFSESLAEALTAVARAQMLLGIADYSKKGAESNEKEVGSENGESADDAEKYRKLLSDADRVCDDACMGRHHCEGHRICDRCGSPKCGCNVKYSEREQMFLCDSCQEKCRKAKS